ncbi:hypothetical protein B0T18DRAFT_397481 [Schizothecium vesticola]|uniref:5'-3' DNA helicase ZGRF1-like N-terminal domain-containing protein n=1 Tax=Schizothecium vesticola TaxID=314040 RepID=A0AA40F9F1_9PEZI|nr:hypothetical protein B0T18DRAFT_397481 [Schizothecium vesticola]
MPPLMSSGPATGQHAPGHTTNPSTALVLEFVCLFTHDLKRKQKRWQDGRVKYHTFNKRVMVYDDRGHFVGDMHWRCDWDFGDGEEVELERGGVIVQVAECVGRQDQDLSEIVDKRVREKEERQGNIAARPSILRSMAVRTPMPQPRLPPTPQDNPQTRHRPLQQVIGTPSGHYGRAVVPTESPFEQRQRASDSLGGEVDPRPSKRRRYDTTPPSKQGYARSLFGASLTLSAVPLSSVPIRRPVPPQSRPSTETPAPPRHQETSSSPPTSPPELPSRAAHQKEIPCSNRPASAIREPLRGNASLLRPDPVLQRVADKPVVNRGFRSDSQVGQELRNSSQYIASNSFSSASAFAASAQPSIFTTDSSTNTLPNLARQPTKLASKNAQCPPLSKTRPRSDKQGARHIIILDDDTEGAPSGEAAPARRLLEGPSAGSGNSAPIIHKRQKPTKKNRPPLASAPTPPKAEPSTGSAPTLAAGVPPQTEKRTELRLKPREKRGLLIAVEPPRKVKKAKNSKSAAKTPTTAPELLESTACPTVIGADTEPSDVAERRRSPLPQDEDLFIWSPPTSMGKAVEELLGNSTRRKFEGRPGLVTPLEESEPPNTPMHSLAKTPILAAEAAFHGFGGEVSNDRAPGLPRVSSCSSPIVIKDPGETKDPISNGTTSVERAQVVEASKHGGGPPAVDTSDMATSSKQPVASVLAQQQTEAPSKCKQTVFEMESSDDEFPRVPVGPHLARLPRRSIKSGEVIGYIPSSSPVPGLPSRGPPDLPVVRHTSQSPERTNSPPFLERDEVRPVDNGTRTSRSDLREGMIASSAISNSPAREHPPSHSRTPEVSCPGPLGDAAADGVLHGANKSLSPLESRERLPIQPASATRRLASRTANDDESSGRIVSAPSTDPPHSLASATENAASAGLAAVAQSDEIGAVPTGKVQSGPAGQLDAPGPIPNMTSSSRSVEKTPPVPECPPGERNIDTSFGNGPANPLRRIANPATRGRKAALKSHAAGQVPRSILPPPDPTLPRPNLRPLADTRLDSAGNDRPKRKMHFPGFVSAKEGGPWSKEADDLLGIGRPAS